MSDFKVKMHQIVCWLGLRPRPRWGSLQRFPRPPNWTLWGLLLREGRGGRRREREWRGKEKGKGKEWNREESVPLALILQFDHCILVLVLIAKRICPAIKKQLTSTSWSKTPSDYFLNNSKRSSVIVEERRDALMSVKMLSIVAHLCEKKSNLEMIAVGECPWRWHINRKARVACNNNYLFENGLLKVTGSHVHSKCAGISETKPYQVVFTANHQYIRNDIWPIK